MNPSPFSLRRQWMQLLALTFTHAVTDLYAGIIAAVFVPLSTRTGVSIAMLIVVTSMLKLTSNLLQIPIGHIHTTRTKATLIYSGVLLAGSSVLIACMPAGTHCVLWMSIVALLAGLGVAMVHPEGLRAVHGLDKLPASLATAIFVVAGFLGFAGGAFISATLTEKFGLLSLRWLYLAAPVAAFLLYSSGVRLPVETADTKTSLDHTQNIPCLPFWPVFAIATILATCSQIQATLLPTYLHKELGYSLSFSGASFTLFGIGGMIGAITWGALAPRLGHLRVLLYSALIGAPLAATYLLIAPHTRYAAALLTFTAFIVYTGFPLCFTLARYALSPLRLGQRMGLISGGSWGIAAIILWILGPLSTYTGMGVLLHLIWLGYLSAAALTLWQTRQYARTRHATELGDIVTDSLPIS